MPRPSLNGMRTHTILTRRQVEDLKRLSTYSGMTVSEHLRRAVDQYLEAKYVPDEKEPPLKE